MILAIIWSLVFAIHLLCMTYWVGGSLYSSLVVRSTVRLLDPGPKASVLLQNYTRFFKGLWQVVPFSLISGWALIIHEGGFANIEWPIHLMGLIGIIMAIVFVVTARGPFLKARRALRPQTALFDKIKNRTLLMGILGILNIFVAAMAHIL